MLTAERLRQSHGGQHGRLVGAGPHASQFESGDLSPAMQKRIERSLAGEKLPGYYPLGEAPVPIW